MAENKEFSVSEDHDGIGEGKASVPKGWKWYVYGTLVWAVYYVYAYTPLFTGWTQSQGLGQ